MKSGYSIKSVWQHFETRILGKKKLSSIYHWIIESLITPIKWKKERISAVEKEKSISENRSNLHLSVRQIYLSIDQV